MNPNLNVTLNRKQLSFLFLLAVGIMLRYLQMSFGYNFDFESYCIVGELAGNFKNVYAETSRYNYAPPFFMLQGLLYRLAQFRPERWQQIYRVFMVSVLTCADLCIAAFIANRYSYRKALLFFLNPVSVFITGYHNQFDNIAVLFALLSICYYNEEEQFGTKDFRFLLFLSLSLLTKHILFLLPFFLLVRPELPLKKRILYSVIPPAVFLVSFLPFALTNTAGFHGILSNVFGYRSFNNAPLLALFYEFIGFPSNLRFPVYCLIMCLLAVYLRKVKYEYVIFVYLIAMVAFSSSITNQYLVIPMAALCVLNVSNWKYIYMVFVSAFLMVDGSGLGYMEAIRQAFAGSFLSPALDYYDNIGYMLATWILLFSLIRLRRNIRKGKGAVA